jgi:hypothetical protein
MVSTRFEDTPIIEAGRAEVRIIFGACGQL